MELNRLHPSQVSRRLSAGFTLIEALIALFVFSIALLGIAALLARSVSVSHSAYLRSLASMQAMDMAERIRANVMADEDVYQNVDCSDIPTSEPNCIDATCNATDLVTWDHAYWCANTKSLFGDGLFESATVTLDGSDYLVSIIWKERKVTEDNKQEIVSTTDADGDAIFTWRVSQ